MQALNRDFIMFLPKGCTLPAPDSHHLPCWCSHAKTLMSAAKHRTCLRRSMSEALSPGSRSFAACSKAMTSASVGGGGGRPAPAGASRIMPFAPSSATAPAQDGISRGNSRQHMYSSVSSRDRYPMGAGTQPSYLLATA